MSCMGDGTNYNRPVNVDRLIRLPCLGISKSGKFLLKLRAHHSGKFASQEKPVIRYVETVTDAR